jgi:tRNA(Ile2) C34 agmatinyltransferase TiaS
VAELIQLKCPNCGANLKIAGDRKQFPCDHCGNTYLLERNLQDLALVDREQLLPLTTYTHQLHQWPGSV